MLGIFSKLTNVSEFTQNYQAAQLCSTLISIRKDQFWRIMWQ